MLSKCNGRHARIATDALLQKELGEPVINWGDSQLQNAGEHRLEYIETLRQADKGSYQPLLDKFKVHP